MEFRLFVSRTHAFTKQKVWEGKTAIVNVETGAHNDVTDDVLYMHITSPMCSTSVFLTRSKFSLTHYNCQVPEAPFQQYCDVSARINGSLLAN